MFDPRTELASHPAHSFHSTDRVNDSFGKWGDVSFCSNDRKMGQNHDQNHRNWNCGGVQFRLETMEEDSGICSPPLWSTSPPQSPVQSRQNSQNNFRYLSPTSRKQAIARGQSELMEMVKNMPESSYELSLKDIVEQTRLGVDQEDFSVNEEKAILGGCGKNGSQRWKNENKGNKVLRSRSIDHNKGMLLKMGFVPFFIGSKKKKTCVTNTCAKVSPKPELVYDKPLKNDHRDWWKKRVSVPSDSESGGGGSSHSGSTGRSGSTGSSGSSGSSRSNSINSSSSIDQESAKETHDTMISHAGGPRPYHPRRDTRRRATGCWPFFHSKKGKYTK